MNGASLVFIDELGRRITDLTTPGPQSAIDRQPTFSPDGRWLVFASDRGGPSPASTHLWAMRAEPGARPFPLTHGPATDRDPVWIPNGRGIVFASDRSGNFELYRLELDSSDGRLRVRAQARRLTTSDAQSLAPALSPDGGRIAFMEVDPDGRSSLWTVSARGGTATQLTRGPTDVTPVFAPDGRTIYFAARALGRADSDIYAIDVRGHRRRVIVNEPDADQSGPRVSADGGLLFATAVYRSLMNQQPVLSSIVVADLRADAPTWRALHDPAVVESRVGVAIAPNRPLSRAHLLANAAYGPSLRRALERALRDAAAESATPVDGEPDARTEAR